MVGDRFRADRLSWLSAAVAPLIHYPLLYVLAKPTWTTAPLGAAAVVFAAASLVALRRAAKIVGDEKERRYAMALFAAVTLAFSTADDPTGYGRVLRDGDGQVRAVVEEKAASDDERAVGQINAGVYCFRADWLWSHLERVEPSRLGQAACGADLVGHPVQAVCGPAGEMDSRAFAGEGAGHRAADRAASSVDDGVLVLQQHAFLLLWRVLEDGQLTVAMSWLRRSMESFTPSSIPDWT